MPDSSVKIVEFIKKAIVIDSFFTKKLIALENTAARVIDGSDARRQDLPTYYWQNEYVDVSLRDNIMNENSMFGSDRRGYTIENRMTIDLNTNSDFDFAELLIEKKVLEI